MTPGAGRHLSAGQPRTARNEPSPGGDLIAFVTLTFALSWAAWAPLVWWTPSGPIRQALLVAGTFGPGAAAVAVMLVRHGRSRLGAVLAATWRWDIPVGAWAVALLGPVVVVLAAIGTAQALGAPIGQWNDPGRLFLVVPVFLYVTAFGGPLGEELGWRGFALSRLQRRLQPTVAVLLLGLVWGLWHLPLFAVDGTVQQQIPLAAFLCQTVATSVIYGWLWNRTSSLPAVIVLHAAVNTTVGVLPVLPEAAGSQLPLWTAVALAGVVAAVVIVRTGGRLGVNDPSPEAWGGDGGAARAAGGRSGR